ncbi:hypothetical protein F8388_007879 [Cannabis sativa]|uniref:Amino acid transporter transmembrane domain-containing protein n=1 Tax=Cannabis sativa TaxID=3483 RepID=A0A7J6FTD6_CANSA|nr:hypothetical protein F8388_007879 [Cannabis sativa]
MVFDKEAGSSSQALKAPPPPREDTPLLGSHKSLSSQAKTFANVFIAIVGAGVLGLPYTFMRTGWVLSLLTMFGVAALTHRCMMLLVYTRRRLESFDGFTKISSFGDLGFIVCGSFGRLLVDVLIILAQAGFCVGYLIFIGNTMANLLTSPTASLKTTMTLLSSKILGLNPKSFYIWGCFPFQLGLNSIPTLTHLAPLSILADVVDLGAMGVVMIEEVIVLLSNRPVVRAFSGFSEFLYGLGVIVYSFEGIGMCLPLESEMKEKNKYGKVLAFTMGFISIMYGSFGALGYFAYGDETQDMITANLGAGLISILIKLGFCVNLFFTLPIMMNPVYEIIERRFWGGRYCLWLRWLSVFVVTLVALLVPNFADFLSLVGSGICCALGFVLPSLFHFLVFKDDMNRTAWWSDVTIFVLGIGLGVSGTWYALQEMFAAKV